MAGGGTGAGGTRVGTVGGEEWAALVQAGLAVALTLGLLYYWFAVADRAAVFLYGHLGAAPFDEVTSSRYWMAGLVAAGVVLLAQSGLALALGRLSVRGWLAYRPPAPARVWALSAGPVGLGVLLITLQTGQPPLPLVLAAACAAVALAGLALALAPTRLAAERPGELLWLALDGLALALPLLLLRAVELPGRGLAVSPTVAYLAAGGSVLGALGWLAVTTALHAWRRRPGPAGVLRGAGELLLAGATVSYLLLPLVHHVLFTPPAYRYVSVASNFFALTPSVQAATVAVAAGLALGVGALRRRLLGRSRSGTVGG